ncbi:MAG: hypothetical protein G3M70_07745 [Candidatus Nitronauta litoralis]|uniref:Uncharacterized protein n=1 Tax=Candidatus Nitronauta litoralis TaxID=2705533 RepID=A0A7T0BVL1_9BACT|nr:MAG: hypothetical protein G3M70_07745 [Candidatus Nitronauta litoralis]
MMVLGREEPLTWNKQIYAFNEISNEIELSRVEDDGLNRYSFLWQGEFEQRNKKFTDLLRHVSQTLEQDPCWFLIWETPRNEKGNRLHDPKIEIRNNDGWATHVGEKITVGQKLIDLDELSGPEPAGHKKLARDAGTFILMGDLPAAPDLTEPPAEKTLSRFAYCSEMAPSSPFLSWVRERSMTLGYWNRNMHSHLGLVIVTRHVLDIEVLREKGFVDTLHDGDDAVHAWL